MLGVSLRLPVLISRRQDDRVPGSLPSNKFLHVSRTNVDVMLWCSAPCAVSVKLAQVKRMTARLLPPPTRTMPGLRRRFSILLIAVLACSRATREAGSTSIGLVARFLDGQACMTVPDSTLSVGQQFAVASIPVAGDTSLSRPGVVEVTAVRPRRCAGLWGDYGWMDYLVREVEPEVPAYGRGPAVVLVGGTATFTYRGGHLQTDMNGDGNMETFRSCTSHEGLHLTLWAGTPLLGKRIWHHYYPLGYDVEPNCSPADYEDS